MKYEEDDDEEEEENDDEEEEEVVVGEEEVEVMEGDEDEEKVKEDYEVGDEDVEEEEGGDEEKYGGGDEGKNEEDRRVRIYGGYMEDIWWMPRRFTAFDETIASLVWQSWIRVRREECNQLSWLFQWSSPRENRLWKSIVLCNA